MATQLFSLSVITKINGIEQVAKALATKKDARLLLDSWAEEYLSYISSRFRTLSGGGGGWKPLHVVTVGQRTERADRGGQPHKATATSILMDTLQLYGSVSQRGHRGQVRKLDVNNFTAECGISGRHLYYDPRVGMLKRNGKPYRLRKRNLAELARLHLEPRNKSRAIIVPPSKAAMNRIDRATRKWVRNLGK